MEGFIVVSFLIGFRSWGYWFMVRMINYEMVLEFLGIIKVYNEKC